MLGYRAWVDFYSGTPLLQTQAAGMTAPAGTATVSDPLGNLMLYSNGEQVWNANHQVMANGSGLNGDAAATMACIAMPVPGNTSQYYLFTVDAEGGAEGLQYSVIDMSLDNGLGEVVQKNIPLASPVCEKVTAVKHATQPGFWLITHRWLSDEYLVFRVDQNGVNPAPQAFATGRTHGGVVRNAQGYLKASPDGKRLAAAVNHEGFVEVLAFNDATGVISPIDGTSFCCEIDGIVRAFGVEFSPNSELLYFTSDEFTPSARESYVYQTTVNTNAWAAINNATQQVHSKAYGLFGPDILQGALQLGPDGKIYGAWGEQSYLSAINAPNVPGGGCDYQLEAVDLSPRRSGMGLPAFVQSFVSPPEVDFSFTTTICAGESAAFEGRASPEPDTWAWDLGNGQTATTPNATTTYDSAGTYAVTLTVTRGDTSVSTTKNIIVTPVPVDPFDGPQTACLGQPATLDAGNPGFGHSWSNGFGGQQIEVFNSGTYSVDISFEGRCERTFETTVRLIRPPAVVLPADTVLCLSDSFTITNAGDNLQPMWSTGETADRITVRESGTYALTDTREGCPRTRQTDVQFALGATAIGLQDTGFCPQTGARLTLAPNASVGRYRWLALADTNTPLTTDTLGTYTLAYVDTFGCVDTLTVRAFPDCYRLPTPTAFSPNGDNLNETFRLPSYGLASAQMQIFDRWGKLLWTGDPTTTGWDGTHNGTPMPEGVYVWVLRATSGNLNAPAHIANSGTVTLIR